MYNTDIIWNELAETGRSYTINFNKELRQTLLSEAIEEGVRLGFKQSRWDDELFYIYLRKN
jgi:hypothetical protein